MDKNDIIQVAEKLYYEANPSTKMDVPSFAYEMVEKLNNKKFQEKSELDLYEYCKINLKLK
jgi:hypothetical protein